MKLSAEATCYMCNAPATSGEHVPPKCLFPEAKDLEGEDLRRLLITVPSCDAHNGRKSRDDEFLMVSLAGLLGNNSIGYRHNQRKVHRAIRRSAGRLLDLALRERKTVTINLDNNKFLSAIVGTPDAARLSRCFEHVVRGLHFHLHGSALRGRVRPCLGFVVAPNADGRTFTRYIRDKVDSELEGVAPIGHNPGVFFFQVTAPDLFGHYLYRLCFYGSAQVYVAVQPEGAPDAHHLGFELMKLGIPTTLSLGERKYRFNWDAKEDESS